MPASSSLRSSGARMRCDTVGLSRLHPAVRLKNAWRRAAKPDSTRFNQTLPMDLATTGPKSTSIALYEKWQLRAAILAVTAPTHGRKVMAGFHVMADARGM